jgi:hypothetical protein
MDSKVEIDNALVVGETVVFGLLSGMQLSSFVPCDLIVADCKQIGFGDRNSSFFQLQGCIQIGLSGINTLTMQLFPENKEQIAKL